jgi:hypothetical protein
MNIEDLIQNLKAMPPETNLPIKSILTMLESVKQETHEPKYSTWDSEKLINESEVAKWLNKNIQTLRNWRVDGKGPKFIKDSRSINYRVYTVKEWIKSKEVQSTSYAEKLKR